MPTLKALIGRWQLWRHRHQIEEFLLAFRNGGLPNQRHLHRRFIEQYTLTHGRLPAGTLPVVVVGATSGFIGRKVDFSALAPAGSSHQSKAIAWPALWMIPASSANSTSRYQAARENSAVRPFPSVT